MSQEGFIKELQQIENSYENGDSSSNLLDRLKDVCKKNRDNIKSNGYKLIISMPNTSKNYDAYLVLIKYFKNVALNEVDRFYNKVKQWSDDIKVQDVLAHYEKLIDSLQEADYYNELDLEKLQEAITIVNEKSKKELIDGLNQIENEYSNGNANDKLIDELNNLCNNNRVLIKNNEYKLLVDMPNAILNYNAHLILIKYFKDVALNEIDRFYNDILKWESDTLPDENIEIQDVLAHYEKLMSSLKEADYYNELDLKKLQEAIDIVNNKIDNNFIEQLQQIENEYSNGANDELINKLDNLCDHNREAIKKSGYQLTIQMPNTIKNYNAHLILIKYFRNIAKDEAKRFNDKILKNVGLSDEEFRKNIDILDAQKHLNRVIQAVEASDYYNDPNMDKTDFDMFPEVRRIIDSKAKTVEEIQNMLTPKDKLNQILENADKYRQPKITSNRLQLDRYNGVFSGTDMIVFIIFPNWKPITIGEATTVTYSIYREKMPVRTLGFINPKGFTKGPRTIAGTIIFTMFHKHIVNRLRQEVPYLAELIRLKPDELPPFDIMISMGNEYGAASYLSIQGITIVDEGVTHSIENMYTENQWSYIAQDIYLLDTANNKMKSNITHSLNLDTKVSSFNMDSLILDDDYKKMKDDIERMRRELENQNKEALERFKRLESTNTIIKDELEAMLYGDGKDFKSSNKFSSKEMQNIFKDSEIMQVSDKDILVDIEVYRMTFYKNDSETNRKANSKHNFSTRVIVVINSEIIADNNSSIDGIYTRELLVVDIGKGNKIEDRNSENIEFRMRFMWSSKNEIDTYDDIPKYSDENIPFNHKSNTGVSFERYDENEKWFLYHAKYNGESIVIPPNGYGTIATDNENTYNNILNKYEGYKNIYGDLLSKNEDILAQSGEWSLKERTHKVADYLLDYYYYNISETERNEKMKSNSDTADRFIKELKDKNYIDDKIDEVLEKKYFEKAINLLDSYGTLSIDMDSYFNLLENCIEFKFWYSSIGRGDKAVNIYVKSDYQQIYDKKFEKDTFMQDASIKYVDETNTLEMEAPLEYYLGTNSPENVPEMYKPSLSFGTAYLLDWNKVVNTILEIIKEKNNTDILYELEKSNIQKDLEKVLNSLNCKVKVEFSINDNEGHYFVKDENVEMYIHNCIKKSFSETLNQFLHKIFGDFSDNNKELNLNDIMTETSISLSDSGFALHYTQESDFHILAGVSKLISDKINKSDINKIDKIEFIIKISLSSSEGTLINNEDNSIKISLIKNLLEDDSNGWIPSE